jgi:hypothetical protein
MMPPIEGVVLFVRHLAPTWRKELQQTCAELLAAFWDRSCLCLSDLARVLPAAQQPLHGRLKRLGRWLERAHLDELAWYHQEGKVPMGMLAIWDADAEEPWYLGTSLGRADWTAQCHRWRMRCECTHRDEKAGILLRHGGDQHQLTNGRHLHRLALVLCLAEWPCASVGSQAWRELPSLLDAPLPLLTPEQEADADPPAALDQPPLEAAAPLIEPDTPYLAQGPADPPPVQPHRGPRYKPPAWLKRFEARGPLSTPRLGWGVLQAADLRPLVRRLVHWVGISLWLDRPRWQPRQVRYRLRHWWPDSRAA